MVSTSVPNYLSGVKMLHIFLGYEYPFTGNVILKLVVKGISRQHPHLPKRAPPITPGILMDVFCGLFCFFTMSRLGSILPSSEKTSSKCFLTRDRVKDCEEGLIITLLQTKTIQFGERVLHIPLIRTDSPLCAVAAFNVVLDSVGGDVVPAFCYKDSNGKVCTLFAKKFVDTIRVLLDRMEREDFHTFRGHSFRRGGASWAFNNGVPGELIQVIGDWKSEAYKIYLEFTTSSKVAIAQCQMASNLPRFR